jgi:hypothetical protein
LIGSFARSKYGALPQTPVTFGFTWLLSFISFARPKEMNQRKGRRKRQPRHFCPPATLGRKGATKNAKVCTVSGFSDAPSQLSSL